MRTKFEKWQPSQKPALEKLIRMEVYTLSITDLYCTRINISTYISQIHIYCICFSFQTLLSLINCIQDQTIMHHRSSKHLNVPKSLGEFIRSFVISDRAMIINWVITNCAISEYLPYIIFHKIPDRGCFSVNICTNIKLRF